MVDQNDQDRGSWDNAEGMSRRSRDTRTYSSDAGMNADNFAFEEEDEQFDGRQRYYRSRPATAQDRGTRQGEQVNRRNQMRQSQPDSQQGRRQREAGRGQSGDDWAQQVREDWQRGPYRDYGWESGDSVLPEFRDPSVHRTAREEQEIEDWRRQQREGSRQGPDFRRAYDAQHNPGFMTGEEEGRFISGPAYGRNEWNLPGPHRGRGPRNYQRSPEAMREDINERLTQHGQIDATDIDVRVENGEVWLTGTVDSRRTKRLAEDVVDSVTGVKDIHNELKIQSRND